MSFFEREAEGLRDELRSGIDRVLGSGWYILGHEVERFEDEFSAYVGSGYAVGVNSGSDALLLSLMCLGVGPGDEVVTVSFSFVSTADAVVRCGATPVFVDIDRDTLCMDTGAVQAAITPRTRAVIPVHLYGHPVDMDPLMKIAGEHGLYVVEDACQAHGTEYKGHRAGSIGRAGCFSFYPTKNLGAYGDAGMVVTEDAGLAEKLRMVRSYGQSAKDSYEFTGVNSRLDAMQAAILRVKLKHLEEWTRRRREIAERYDAAIDDGPVTKPLEKECARHVYHQYVIRLSERDSLREFLAERGIGTLVHYPTPIHRQRSYDRLVGAVDLPVTEETCRRVLSLPMNPWMTDDEVEQVTAAVNAWQRRDGT